MKHLILNPSIKAQQIFSILFLTTLSICLPLNTITAQDTTGINLPISIRTEQNRTVKNVFVSALYDDSIAVAHGNTNSDGVYTFSNLMENKRYRIVAAKSDELFVGVTTFDIALLIRHIQGIETITSPYALIAGDVDESGEIDAADVLNIRNFILRKIPSLPKRTWRFVDKSYVFTNPTNPLLEAFPEHIKFDSLSASAKGDFVAVKMGDVSSGISAQSTLNFGDDDNALSTRSARKFDIFTDDMDLIAGKEYSITLTSKGFEAMAYQFSLGFMGNNATIKSFEKGNLSNMTVDNFAISNNALSTSWDGQANEKTAQLFTVTFLAHKNAKLSEILTINQKLTRAVAFDTNGNPMNINLSFTNSNTSKTFTLYPNYPNPVKTTTTISFDLPAETDARLTVFDALGRTVKTINRAFEAGRNEVTLDGVDLPTNGLLYYRLETPQYSATKSMFVVR